MWLYYIVAQIEAYFMRRYLYTGLESLRFQTRYTSAKALGREWDLAGLRPTSTDASKEEFVGGDVMIIK